MFVYKYIKCMYTHRFEYVEDNGERAIKLVYIPIRFSRKATATKLSEAFLLHRVLISPY